MTPYRVLARKYRPRNFDELIGQEALVRTLRNAITSGRIAHAFMLTGVRGVGKTTTARIIARALNYTGPDGTSGPTVGPTDDCAICQAIAEDRHPDVIEMDAASRTGVDDIREIIEGVRYAPASARYKIYIIDEVHMLSKNAFNALLKTLEEPPPHVKFIFATTEIRKVPVTILSRCQRFDLRRVDAQTLATHYGNICTKEEVTAEPEALELIGRAADGSVRDGLSLLDQAISLGDGAVTAEQVKNMLGFADQGQAYSLLSTILKGDAATSLQQVTDMIARGLEPLAILQDLMDGTHILTRMKVAPKDGGALTSGLSPDLQAELKTLASENGIATLARVWQLLLKGVTEVQYALDPRPALEMLIIRSCYAADLPDPADLIRRLEEDGDVSAVSRGGNNDGPRGATTINRAGNAPVVSSVRGGAAVSPKLDAQPQRTVVANSNLDTLEAVVALIEDDGSLILGGQIRQYVRPIKIDNANCRIDCALAPGFPTDLAGTVGKRLTELTGRRWMVMVGKNENAQPSLKEIETAQKQARLEAVSQDETVRAVLEAFPGAEIVKIQEN